jgi:excisionase family DNA binding protein
MNRRPTQFGVRENTASSRRHASRLVVAPGSNADRIQRENREVPDLSLVSERTAGDSEILPHAAPQRAATVGTGRETPECSTFSIPPGISQKSGQAFEPLIGCPEAAKLLGNIHVKTLQRYARLGRLPGYQIGGHWFFRASELDAWLQSRINSSCHPCRLD